MDPYRGVRNGASSPQAAFRGPTARYGYKRGRIAQRTRSADLSDSIASLVAVRWQDMTHEGGAVWGTNAFDRGPESESLNLSICVYVRDPKRNGLSRSPADSIDSSMSKSTLVAVIMKLLYKVVVCAARDVWLVPDMLMLIREMLASWACWGRLRAPFN